MRKGIAVGILVAILVVAYLWSRAPASKEKPTASRPSATSSVSNVREAIPRVARVPSAASGQAAADPKGGALFTASWGSGPDQLGHERPQEGNPLGPMSLAVDGKGRVHVLDGVNGRVVRRGADGKLDTTFKIDGRDLQDIAVASDGSSAVLDRSGDKAVTLYDESGKPRGKLALEGQGISDVGSITGVFVDGSDVYVEREHGPLVKIGKTDGTPADPRSELPGRPSRDGLSILNAGIIEAPAGRVYVSSIERATMKHRFTRELRLESFVRMLLLLDTDRAGTIYFAAEVEKAEKQAEIVLSCLDPLTGAPIGGAILPANTLPEESLRDLVVLDGGGVILALRSEQGVTYSRYDCDGAA